ncbi:SRPBCC family protein [Streptomyces somaliensis DSM 40738]|uniref:SRPBCC family protein n=1 Tax=Streptomyces somaliensis (strain ATCC 33201 / DSM 40738 / JCM 12659 / KCTC 9044 / NCTC 11332 / NRRL B-12077 / IP 733) TaxID=1134445 RepID=A0AA44IC69_STRE0|nr:SRPBCC family protein [Streptomyces somaliensis]MCQ0023875.1 SRPBCC family protein [Streptomyces somaliensis DSM 40738]NKY13360.1 SRPBCC family protein [Streptomyces somaliensis DSM 40738]
MNDLTTAPEVVEEVTVRTSPRAAWAAVSDVRRMGEWSPECRGAWLLGGGGRLRRGTRFLGRNRASWLPWITLCRVVETVPGEVFTFDVSFFGVPLSRWTYRFAAVPGGCRVTEEWYDRRRGLHGRLLTGVAPLLTGVVRRSARNRTTVRATLVTLRDVLEAGR